MTNNQRTHLSQNGLPRRLQQPQQVTPVRGVRQDNPTPPRARTASPQPAPPKNEKRSTPIEMYTTHTHQGKRKTRKTIHTTLWLKPRVRAELERKAKEEGVSISTTGAAFLEWAMQQSIYTQHTALLDPIISKAIGKYMRGFSNRLAVLLVRSSFVSEQTRSIVTNILNKLPGITQEMVQDILMKSSNTAKRNITRKTPQLETVLKEVETWMQEEVKPDG